MEWSLIVTIVGLLAIIVMVSYHIGWVRGFRMCSAIHEEENEKFSSYLRTLRQRHESGASTPERGSDDTG